MTAVACYDMRLVPRPYGPARRGDTQLAYSVTNCARRQAENVGCPTRSLDYTIAGAQDSANVLSLHLPQC